MIEPIDFMVDGHLMTLRQQGKKDCWAVVATMLLSWRLNRDMSVAETMTLAGPQFLQLYLDGKAIDHSQMPSFLGDFLSGSSTHAKVFSGLPSPRRPQIILAWAAQFLLGSISTVIHNGP